LAYILVPLGFLLFLLRSVICLFLRLKVLWLFVPTPKGIMVIDTCIIAVHLNYSLITILAVDVFGVEAN